MSLSEADTCRKLVVPRLQAAGWDDEPHSIAEQRTITDGRIVPVGKGFVRRPPRRVDYLLRYERNFPLAVVEAKPAWKRAGDGLQQAKQYAEMLGLKFAYASNGHEIIEFDYFTGLETIISTYPTPAGLWARYRTGTGLTDTSAERLVTPMNHAVGKGERYYQELSLLSAFQIGWKELTIGNWITRLVPREYTLRATGWVRVVAGVQSLFSVYFLALWVLTYFGRPFE